MIYWHTVIFELPSISLETLFFLLVDAIKRDMCVQYLDEI